MCRLLLSFSGSSYIYSDLSALVPVCMSRHLSTWYNATTRNLHAYATAHALQLLQARWLGWFSFYDYYWLECLFSSFPWSPTSCCCCGCFWCRLHMTLSSITVIYAQFTCSLCSSIQCLTLSNTDNFNNFCARLRLEHIPV